MSELASDTLSETLPYKKQKVIKEYLILLNKELSNILEHFCNNNNDVKVNMTIISTNNHSERIINVQCFISILNLINWDDEFDEKNKITYRKQTVSTIKKIIKIITDLRFLYSDYLSETQQKCFNEICKIPLDKNWSIDCLGNLSNPIALNNIVLNVGYPLQKCVGVDLRNVLLLNKIM